MTILWKAYVSGLSVLMLAGFTFAGEVTEFANDRPAWEAAVGEFQTIDFVGGDPGAWIGDDFYDEFGAMIIGGFYHHTSSYLNDGEGMFGPGGAWVEFDEPINWIGADHPGSLAMQLYLGDELVYDSEDAIGGTGGAGFFSGLVSELPFDRVYLYRTSMPEVYIDDIHFGGGVIPAPGALALIGFAALAGTRRRRQ